MLQVQAAEAMHRAMEAERAELSRQAPSDACSLQMHQSFSLGRGECLKVLTIRFSPRYFAVKARCLVPVLLGASARPPLQIDLEDAMLQQQVRLLRCAPATFTVGEISGCHSNAARDGRRKSVVRKRRGVYTHPPTEFPGFFKLV
jgi:hypothetical protein